jgi:carbonic anhydrase
MIKQGILMACLFSMIACHNSETKFQAKSQEDTLAINTRVMPGMLHGIEQSPINILSSTNSTGHHVITLYFKDKINQIENKGHTVQLDFNPGSTIVQDDTVFEFKQCHFHTPSEHLIDGNNFPLEMHIVNVMQNTTGDSIPQYLVIGILFKEGKENKFLNDFLNAIPTQAHTTATLPAGKVSFTDLFDSIPHQMYRNFYYYRGSLTTPPYTETVRWYIAKKIFEASKDQITRLQKVEGNNARHVQGTYGRVVEND